MNCIIAQLLQKKKRLFEVKSVKITSKKLFRTNFDSQAVDLGVWFFATLSFMTVKEKWKNLETMSYTVKKKISPKTQKKQIKVMKWNLRPVNALDFYNFLKIDFLKIPSVAFSESITHINIIQRKSWGVLTWNLMIHFQQCVFPVLNFHS